MRKRLEKRVEFEFRVLAVEVMREKDKDCRLFMRRMNLGAKM